MGRSTTVKNLMVKPVTLAEARILTDSDSGKTYFLDAAGGFDITLPAPRGGVNFEFIIKTAPTTDYTISTDGDADNIVGHVVTSNVTVGEDQDFEAAETTGVNNVYLVANQGRIGDSVTLVSDGTHWFAEGHCALNGAITFTHTAVNSASASISPSISTSVSPSTSRSVSPSISPSVSPST